MVQVNYLRFLASAISSAPLFHALWGEAIRRLHLCGSREVLRQAVAMPPLHRAPPKPLFDEESIFSLTNGDVALFPGVAVSGKPVIVIATPYLPFPLSHGGAVRIYNLMREGSREFDWVMVAFQEHWMPPPGELLALCAEVTLVRRAGSHYRISTTRPDTVEEFDSLSFRSALRQTIRKWRPQSVQLEFTQMAQYAQDCAPAKTLLVEHDITFDLYEQMVRQAPLDHELATQYGRWRNFETAAWASVDAVITMSEKDRLQIGSARARAIPNGVDTERYQPSVQHPETNSILFIGSFAHHPNRSAVEWFVREVWPLLDDLTPDLHIIAGMNVKPFDGPRIKTEGFVKDVRPAYRGAAVVIAPLITSAGTNIKILEAMAMGKAIVSTSAGINGLDVEGVVIANNATNFASKIRTLLCDAEARRHLGRVARACVETRYSWNTIASLQSSLYRELAAS